MKLRADRANRFSESNERLSLLKEENIRLKGELLKVLAKNTGSNLESTLRHPA